MPLAPEVGAGRPGSPSAACHRAQNVPSSPGGAQSTAQEIGVHLRGVSAKEITAILSRDNPRCTGRAASASRAAIIPRLTRVNSPRRLRVP